MDTIVLASLREEDSQLKSYQAAGLLVEKIGDLRKVRNLRGAVTDGANIGLTLDRDLQENANGEVIASLPSELQI